MEIEDLGRIAGKVVKWGWLGVSVLGIGYCVAPKNVQERIDQWKEVMWAYDYRRITNPLIVPEFREETVQPYVALGQEAVLPGGTASSTVASITSLDGLTGIFS